MSDHETECHACGGTGRYWLEISPEPLKCGNCDGTGKAPRPKYEAEWRALFDAVGAEARAAWAPLIASGELEGTCPDCGRPTAYYSADRARVSAVSLRTDDLMDVGGFVNMDEPPDRELIEPLRLGFIPACRDILDAIHTADRNHDTGNGYDHPRHVEALKFAKACPGVEKSP